VLDVLVAEVVLQSACVVSVVGKLEAAGVPKHVRMHGERHLCGLAESCHEMMETHRAYCPPRSLTNTWASVGFRDATMILVAYRAVRASHHITTIATALTIAGPALLGAALVLLMAWLLS
jgi:hypothetical protein